MKKEIIIMLVLIGIVIAWQFDFLNMLFAFLNPSLSQELTNFTNTACKTCQFDYSIPTNIQECIYESLLVGAENSENVTFEIGLKFNGGGWTDGGIGCTIQTSKAEVYNYNTGNYEEIWNFSQNFGSVESLSFIKSDAEIPSYFTQSGKCWSIMMGGGRPQYLCKREKFFLNNNYIQDNTLKFRTTLKSTCGDILWYDGIEIGYSDWGAIQCNTPADTNCDNSVDRTELGIYINQWINNQVTRDALGETIVAWINS